MNRLALVALVPLVWTAPALAQMDPSMPGMSMPAKPKPSAEANAAPGTGKAMARSGPSRARRSAGKVGSAPLKSGVSMPNMAMPGMSSPKMGGMAGMSMPQGTSGGPQQQDIPQTPPPPPPREFAADLFFDPTLMAQARSELHQEQGGQIYSKVFANILEYQPGPQGGGYRWDGEAWVGGDINRLWIKSEGEGTRRGGVDSAEIQALYSRAVGPYTDLQVGVRYDFKPTPSRTYATAGFETIFPYWFQVEGAVFLSNKGELLGRLEGYYDLLLTQQLVLQPRIELNFAAQNSRDIGIGAGLSNAELGLRLRYEIRREFAPYIGVSYTQSVGSTADYARASGTETSSVKFVTGIRTWF